MAISVRAMVMLCLLATGAQAGGYCMDPQLVAGGEAAITTAPLACAFQVSSTGFA